MDIFNYHFFQSETAFLFRIVCFLICLLLSLTYLFSSGCKKLLKQHSWIGPLVLSVFVIWLFGIRILRMDSFMYAWAYRTDLTKTAHFDLHSEWFWLWIANIFHMLKQPANVWLAFISLCYILFTYYVCRRWLWENIMMALLFHFCSLSFLAYGVNTARQGLACAMLLVAFTLWIKDKYRILPCIIFLLAFGTHRSSALPVIAFLMANTVIKKPSWALIIWFSSIAISLVLGNLFLSFIGEMNFDERVAGYASTTRQTIYHVGFRWDFLLYGSAPIFYFWYVTVKRKIVDNAYQILAITYILTNAVWIQMIRMPYTDRVAYLSWFMMPLLLAYPSIRIPIWEDQDRKAGIILLLQLTFSFVMLFV